MYLVMWKVKCVGLSGEDYLKLIITNHMIRWKQEAAHKEAPKVREQEEVQDVMKQLQNSSYNKSIVRQVHIAALHKEQQQIAEAVERAERGDDS